MKRAIRKAEGNLNAVARLVGLSVKQTRRHLVRLELGEQLEKVRQRTGWHRPHVRDGRRRDRWKRVSARAEKH